MQLLKRDHYSGRIVTSAIMDKYIKANPGLLSKKTGNYQMFNRGHIYEAIDDAAATIIKNDEDVSDELMEKYVFGKYLALDTIIASRGGDNPITNTSIKSESADLYDYNTIKKQLEQIKYILDNGLISQEETSERIKDLFLEKTKFANEDDYERAAQKAFDKLLDILNIS